ncbi:MAG: aldehyde dehydrogenase family protein, partial [Duodenibacillus sp.]|nr:aldehyde dehydrogenase family protein [Duodenibacillus sp.]
PFIWLPKGDYALAADQLMGSIFLNSGQTCTALSRLLVPRARLAEAERLLVSKLPAYIVGDPLDPATRIGPVASRQQFEKVSSYIRKGLEEGARLVAGGVPEAPAGDARGWYVRPTILSDVTPGMTVAQEEIFGPVLCILAYDTVDEAVEIANGTIYGLNAAVFGDKAECLRIARRLKSGNVYVNDAPRDGTAPFGGFKQSGIGREGGIEGIKEFTELKTVHDHSTF